jgi:hypothetical protein
MAFIGAAIIGGCWTRQTFREQREVEKSLKEVEKLTREIEVMRAEPRLEIDLDTRPLKVPGSNERYVVGSVRVKNVGNANTLLNLEKEPVRIYRVTVGAQEVWQLVRLLDLQTAPRLITTGLMCHAGATTHADFITPIEKPGLYVVTFSAVRSEAEAATAKSLGAVISGPKGRIEWQAQRYFTVE